MIGPLCVSRKCNPKVSKRVNRGKCLIIYGSFYVRVVYSISLEGKRALDAFVGVEVEAVLPRLI